MTAAKPTDAMETRIEELEEAREQHACDWEDTLNALFDWICIIDLDFHIVRNNFDADFSHGLCPECAGPRIYGV